jgi:hypothetical protein
MADGSRWLPDRLGRIKAKQQAEQERQAQERDCPHDQGVIEYLGYTSDGIARFYRGCRTCKAPLEGGKWLKAPDDKTGVPVGFDYRLINPPCVRCGDFGTQLHHFAPKALFGRDESELWPTAWLCQGCHDYWHRTVDGRGAA